MDHRSREWLDYQADQIEILLTAHKLDGAVVGVQLSPRWVRFVLQLGMGTRISSLEALREELAMVVGAPAVRLTRSAGVLALEGGSQRALRSIEDFTEFEQRAAYFDGDPVIATKKGVNPLERGSQVHFMGELQKLFDFPPAPKLKID